MKRVPVRGSTVRDYRDKVQVALFDNDNQYAGLFILEYDEAAKLARKLLRKAQHRVVQDADRDSSSDPASSGQWLTDALDAEGEALPPGIEGPVDSNSDDWTVYPDAPASENEPPSEANLIDKVAGAYFDGACVCPGEKGDTFVFSEDCPVHIEHTD